MCTLSRLNWAKQTPGIKLETTEAITSPYAIWVRDALEEAYEQVRLHSGQAVQRQKRLYDRRAVKRNFTVGDWVMRYYAPAKKCKLDSAWIGPYLVVSFMGWTIGIQKDPGSPIVMVHCQDAKKIPAPRGAVSWLKSKESSTVPSLLSITAVPSASGGMETTGAQSAPPARLSGNSSVSVTSSVDVSSATLISAHSRVEGTSGELDSSCVIHPFHVHKMDSGPVRLMTIAHAFNYRVAVLRDGVRSDKKGGKMFFSKRKYIMGTTGGGDVSNCFNANGRGTCFCIKNEGITWRTTDYAV